MPRFKVNIGGQNFSIEAPSEEALPEIVETISNEQIFQKRRDVQDVGGATPEDFTGEIVNPPPMRERIMTKIPSIAQFAGGVLGGVVGARGGKPNIGSAIGGTLGRGAGELIQSADRQLEQDPAGTIARQASLGPLFGTISGMSVSEKRRLGKEFLKTGAIEGALGAVGGALTRFGTGITDAIGRALLGDRVVDRGIERGFKSILDPKFYQSRVPKQLAIKANKFFDKLSSVTGKRVSSAISQKGVGDKKVAMSQVKDEILSLDKRFGGIDNFGPEVSPAQKKILKELRQGFLDANDDIDVQGLWELRKKFDKTRFNRSFKPEAREYLDSFRRIISTPIRESSEEVAEAFGRYGFVKEQQDEIGKKFSAFTLGDPTQKGEIFATNLESFNSSLLVTNKDDQIRLLRQLDSFLDADDRVIEELLDASAAEAIERGNVGVTLPGRVIARLLGGRKGVARAGQAIQSPGARIIKRGVGRTIPTITSEAFSVSPEDEE